MEKVSNAFNVDKAQISKLELGETKLHSEWIKKFCKFYKITPNQLFGYDNYTSLVHIKEEILLAALTQIIGKNSISSNDQVISVFAKVYQYLSENPDCTVEKIEGYIDAIIELEK